MPTPQCLLDTNILVHYVRNSAVWAGIRDRYQLFTIEPRPLISIVTAGELRSLAVQRGWGGKKLDQTEFCLGFFVEVAIDNRRFVDAYASLDAEARERGHKPDKNDLWIAATAAVTGATLLTTDKDFDALDAGVFRRTWIDPSPRA